MLLKNPLAGIRELKMSKTGEERGFLETLFRDMVLQAGT